MTHTHADHDLHTQSHEHCTHRPGGAPVRAGECAIEARNVSIRFGDYTALDNVHFKIDAGSFVTLIGPNGAGKSTLLRALLGLVPLTAGEALLLGQPPLRTPREAVGYVPQVKTLDRRFPARALELVATGVLGRWPARLRGPARDRSLAALEQTGGLHLAEKMIGHLSGGELQRVYIARALVRRPRVILLDEPAAGMDVAGQADLYDILEHYQAETGATVLMITHDWEGAQFHASHVLLLNRTVVSLAPPVEALADANLRRAFGHMGHRHPVSPPSLPNA